MRRLVLLLAALVVVVSGAGCEVNYKAGVLVRWRLMDGLTGTPAGRCTGEGPHDDTSGYCCAHVGDHDIGIERIRLRAERIDTDGGYLHLEDIYFDDFCMVCDPAEHSTGPVLEPGTYKLSVEAYSCGRQVGDSPAPLVRELPPRGLANVQVQAIRLYPSDALDPRNPGAGAVCQRGALPGQKTCGFSDADLGSSPADLTSPSSSDGL